LARPSEIFFTALENKVGPGTTAGFFVSSLKLEMFFVHAANDNTASAIYAIFLMIFLF
jgi:hypothetical protein